MKRDWLIFKTMVLVAFGALLVKTMGRIHGAVDGMANRALAEMDKGEA